MKHSILAPSSAAIRMQCPGSRTLCEKYPDEGSPKSQEGELAHAVCAAMSQHKPIPDGATEEMLDGAELWFDTITDNFLKQPHVEERVNCSSIHPLCWGTPDLWNYSDDHKTLTVMDYKFGHRHVEVFENWQLLEYAIGIISSHPEIFGFTHFSNSPIKVDLIVVQPRSYHKDGPVRKWSLLIGDLMPYAKRLEDSEHASMVLGAETRVGKNCIDCSARHVCSTLQSSAYSAVQLTGESTPLELSDAAAGGELTLIRQSIDVLKARGSGLEQELMGRIEQGCVIPGWSAERGSGREKWNKPVDEVIALGNIMGVDVSKKAALTPKQAIGAGLDPAIVGSYSERTPGEVVLVPFKQSSQFK